MQLLESRVAQNSEKDPQDKREHLQHIQKALRKCSLDTTELQISPGFSVMQANVFSGQIEENIGRTFNNSDPKQKRTLADIHSAIHQSLISYNANRTAVFAKESLECMPVEVQEIHQSIMGSLLKEPRDHSKVIPAPILLATEFKNTQLHLEYNIPLRNHSANMKIVYDPKSKATSLSIIFYGQNGYRWLIGAENGIQFLTSKKIEVIKYFYDDASLKFDVHAASKEQINHTLDAFFKMAQATLKNDYMDLPVKVTYFFQKFWSQYNPGKEVRALQKEYSIVTFQDRKRLLSAIDKTADISEAIKEQLKSDNNLFLLNIGALYLADLKADPTDPLTCKILDLSQKEFDRLTSMVLLDFYRAYRQQDDNPIKSIFGELMTLSLDEETIDDLTSPFFVKYYSKKICSMTELATLFKKEYGKFCSLSLYCEKCYKEGIPSFEVVSEKIRNTLASSIRQDTESQAPRHTNKPQ